MLMWIIGIIVVSFTLVINAYSEKRKYEKVCRKTYFFSIRYLLSAMRKYKSY